jgi:hypothetical protein
MLSVLVAFSPPVPLVERAMPGATMSDSDILGVLKAINRSEIHTGHFRRNVIDPV